MKPLSRRMRESVRHVSPEGVSLLDTFLASPERRAAAYAAVLRELAPVYGALEAGLVIHADHPVVAPFYRPELFRLAAVRSDLARLGALDGPPRTDAAVTLARRVLAHSADRPEGLVAHVFALFAIDVSLARVAGPWLNRLLGQPNLRALRFERTPDLRVLGAELDAYFDAVPRRARDYIAWEAAATVALRAELTAGVARPALQGAPAPAPLAQPSVLLDGALLDSPLLDSPLLDTLRRSLSASQR